MASLLQSRVPAMSFSSSLSSSGVQLRPSPAFAVRPRRRISTVKAKIREIFMPALSSTMTEGKIVSWNKSEGDVISKGESVVVVESDKADMDVETFYGGILASIVVGEGEVAPVGSPIGFLAETEDEIAEAKAKAASSSSPSAPPPAAASAPSPPSPVVAAPTPPPPPTAADGPRKIVATPYAKKLAKKHKIDVNSVVGTGPFGRITAADIEAAAGIAPSKSTTPAAVAAPPPPVPAAPKAAAATTYPEIPGSTVVPFTGTNLIF